MMQQPQQNIDQNQYNNQFQYTNNFPQMNRNLLNVQQQSMQN